MKTTELYVEQILIGGLILAIFALPAAPDIVCWLTASAGAKGANNISLGLAVAGSVVGLSIAYLLGLIFDRVIDTLMDPWLCHLRLRFAHEQFAKIPIRTEDPFPEADLTLRVFQIGGDVAERFDYLRVRIRLSRAMAALGPGLTVATAVGLRRIFDPSFSIFSNDPLVLGFAIMAAYIVALTLTLFLRSAGKIAIKRWETNQNRTSQPPPPDEKADKTAAAWMSISPPRTDRRNAFDLYAKKRGLNGEDAGRLAGVWDLTLNPSFALAIAAVGVLVGLSIPWHPVVTLVAVTGAVFTARAGWTWARVLNTHMQFLNKAGREPRC